jgi:hypothetical protein
MFYTDRAHPGDRRHVIFKNLALLAPLGIKQPPASFPLSCRTATAMEEAVNRAGADDVRADQSRRGVAEQALAAGRFGALATAIRKTSGLRSVVVWGPGEQKLATAVVEPQTATPCSRRRRRCSIFSAWRRARR